MKGTLLVVAALVSALLLSAPFEARADDRPTALLPFTGKSASTVRSRVYRELQDSGVRLVPLRRAAKAAVKGRSKARVLRALRAGLLVKGAVSKPGKKWVANIEVHNRKRRLKRIRVTSKSSRRLAQDVALRLIQTDLLPLVPDEPEDKPKKKPVVKKLDVEPSPSAKTKAPEPEKSEPPPPPPPAKRVKEKGPPRIVVRPFTGKNASRIRTSSVRGLKRPGVDLVANKTFTNAARRVGANLRSQTGHVRPAQILGVSGLVEGEVEYEGGFWSAYVRLVDGQSDKVLSQLFFEGETLGALSRSVQRGIWTGFADAVDDLDRWQPMAIEKVDPEPPPVSVDTRTDTEKRRERDERRYARRIEATQFSALDVEFGLRLLHRNFSYNEDLGGDLRGYQLGLGPGIGMRMKWYPGAHVAGGVAAMFGIDFDYELMFKVDSKRADGAAFPTRSQAYGIGLRWRYPMRRLEPSLIAGFGAHSFKLDVVRQPGGGSPLESDVPGVKYKFGRFGADLRIALPARLSLHLRAAFLWVFDVGGISAARWFSEATGNGMEAGIVVGYGLPKGFEVRLGVDYRRYFLDLNPVPPSPPFVAGGALDNFWGVTIGIGWRD